MNPTQETQQTEMKMTQQTLLAQGTQKTGAARPKVIVAMPAYNEEKYIGSMVLAAKQYADEVIVIDDGSTDETSKIARLAGATVIRHEQNKGKGAAIQSILAEAKKRNPDALVLLDADAQHHPEEIPKLVTPILNKEADIIIGSRFLKPTQSTCQESRVISPPPRLSTQNSELGTQDSQLGTQDSQLGTRNSRLPVMPKYRKFGIGVITLLWNFGSKVRVSDAQSGFRAYGRKIFKTLPLSEKGMSISIETLEKARRKGATIKEVPISCLYVPSTLNFGAIRHGLGVALSVVRIRRKNSLIGSNNARNQGL